MVEGSTMAVNGRKRQGIEIYVDVLRAIHKANRSGGRLNLYRIERDTGLAHERLVRYLSNLENLELIENGLMLTSKGYQFLVDMSSKVIPVLRQYRLWPEETQSARALLAFPVDGSI